MMEALTIAVMGIAFTYLVGEVNKLQDNVQLLLQKVAILEERSLKRQSSDE
jgi:hypothetical protein